MSSIGSFTGMKAADKTRGKWEILSHAAKGASLEKLGAFDRAHHALRLVYSFVVFVLGN